VSLGLQVLLGQAVSTVLRVSMACREQVALVVRAEQREQPGLLGQPESVESRVLRVLLARLV